jgi:hypothetical protein
VVAYNPFRSMTPNLTIYLINQSRELAKAWRELTDIQKREVLKECETAEEKDLEMIIYSVIEGQYRLF